MILRIERRWKKDTYTIGNLFVNDKFFCNTLEDRDRGLHQYMNESDIARVKVYGETAIPDGRYKVILSPSPKFKRILPAVLNVKGFSGIRIHAGNTPADSLGCILVGKNKAKGMVVESRKTEAELVKLMQDCGEEIELVIE